MTDFRCPRHDLIFQSDTDHRKPGSAATANSPAMPVNGHVDCPRCQKEAKEPVAGTSRKIG